MKKTIAILLSVLQLGILGCQSKGQNPQAQRTPVAEGGQTGNGGFAFLRSSKSLLDESQRRMISLLIDNHARLDKKLSSLSPSVDVVRLSELVSQMKKDVMTGESATAINADGQTEPKILNIEGQGGASQIVVQPQFFASFAGEELTESNLHEVMRAIIHEALHVFGYNEEKAYGTSLYILQNLLGVDHQSLSIERREAGYFGGKLKKCGEVTEPSCSELRARLKQGQNSLLVAFELKEDDDLKTYSILYQRDGAWVLRLETGETFSPICLPGGPGLSCKAQVDDNIILTLEVGSSSSFATLKRERRDSLPTTKPVEWISAKYWLFSL